MIEIVDVREDPAAAEITVRRKTVETLRLIAKEHQKDDNKTIRQDGVTVEAVLRALGLWEDKENAD